jgi:hypothetical protein
MNTQDEQRMNALAFAVDMANVINEHAPIDLVGDNGRHWTDADVVVAAEVFLAFLRGDEAARAAKTPKIQVAWRDETPDVIEFARGGGPLPATHGATPLVSTTVVGKSNPESLREMRARAAEEREKQAQLDNEAERF